MCYTDSQLRCRDGANIEVSNGPEPASGVNMGDSSVVRLPAPQLESTNTQSDYIKLPPPTIETSITLGDFTIYTEDIKSTWREEGQYKRVLAVLEYKSGKTRQNNECKVCRICTDCYNYSYRCSCQNENTQNDDDYVDQGTCLSCLKTLESLEHYDLRPSEIDTIMSILTFKRTSRQVLYGKPETRQETLKRQDWEFERYGFQDCTECNWPLFMCQCNTHKKDIKSTCYFASRTKCLCKNRCIDCNYNLDACVCHEYCDSCGRCYACRECGEDYCTNLKGSIFTSTRYCCEYCDNVTCCDPETSVCDTVCDCYEQCEGCKKFKHDCRCTNVFYSCLFRDVQLPCDVNDQNIKSVLLKSDIPLYILFKQRCFTMPFYNYMFDNCMVSLETASIYMHEIMVVMAHTYLPDELMNNILEFLEPEDMDERKKMLNFDDEEQGKKNQGILVPMNKMFEKKHSRFFNRFIQDDWH